jgi:hypothetical protein
VLLWGELSCLSHNTWHHSHQKRYLFTNGPNSDFDRSISGLLDSTKSKYLIPQFSSLSSNITSDRDIYFLAKAYKSTLLQEHRTDQQSVVSNFCLGDRTY